MSYLDPTTIRLSKSLLLSDAMGCTSVYRDGIPNRFSESSEDQLLEGSRLADFLEVQAEDIGPFGVCYGYISPELSRKIVKYQNPDKPSYHRWDFGAAMDVCYYMFVEQYAPIQFAIGLIQEQQRFSRVITYSESEWVCVGTRRSESDKPRLALYENRYVGTKKPKYVRYSDNLETRIAQLHDALDALRNYDWRGRGWPSYHGGGLRQFEHYRVSRFTHVIDYLYDKNLVHKGVKNTPPLLNKEKFERWLEIAKMAGNVVDAATHHSGLNRPSITKAYNMHVPAQNWSKRFTLQLVPAEGYHPDDIAHNLESMQEVAKITIARTARADITKINILGEDYLCL
jgi:hypothetical protein